MKAGDRIHLVKCTRDKHQVGVISERWLIHERVLRVGWGIIGFPVAAECIIVPPSPPQPPKDAAGLGS